MGALPDEPHHPDHELLGVCDEALHRMGHALRLIEASQTIFGEGRCVSGDRHDRAPHLLREHILEQESSLALMGMARNLPATTPAGIYAKALLVRQSRSGAAALAQSLAKDLTESPQLRALLWPAGGAR